MNLNEFKTQEDSWMELYAPDGTKTDIRIQLVSRDSTTYQGRIRKLAEKNRKATRGMSITDIEKESMNIYVACTVGWENMQENEKDVKCESDNVQHIYEAYPWIYENVREFIDDRANFLAN